MRLESTATEGCTIKTADTDVVRDVRKRPEDFRWLFVTVKIDVWECFVEEISGLAV